MSHLLSTALILLATSAHAKIIPPSEYPFPVQDPIFASLLSGAITTNFPFKFVYIEPLPERRNVRLLENRNTIPLALFKQKNPDAPLVFIISGIGGTAFSGNALNIATQMFALGYTAITLPDPMNWQYALGISKSGTPGFLPNDSIEYYEFLKTVQNYLINNEGLRPKSYSTIGYSYGGLLVLYLENIDSVQKKFNFQNIVSINPAVDINFGINTLDQFYAIGNKFSNDYKDYLMGLVYNAAAQLMDLPFTMENLLKILTPFMKLQLNDEKWLVGQAFRKDLSDIVFVSQQIKDVGILKQHASEFFLNAREAEAMTITFHDYMMKLVIPNIGYRKNLNSDSKQLVVDGGLYSLLDMITNDKKIHMQENADDFLLKPGDTDLLEGKLGDKLFLYPFGGHIGNLWFNQNANDLKSIMTIH